MYFITTIVFEKYLLCSRKVTDTRLQEHFYQTSTND